MVKCNLTGKLSCDSMFYSCFEFGDKCIYPEDRMSKPTLADLTNRFTYNAPTPDRVERHKRLNTLMLETAIELTELCDEGRQLSCALTALEEVRMRANASIAGVK